MKRLNRIMLICGMFITLILIIIGILNPVLTKKRIVNDFQNNKHHFNIVKNYLLTKETGYYINKNNKEDIDDKDVKEAADYLMNKLGYEKMHNYSLVVSDFKLLYVTFYLEEHNGLQLGMIYTSEPDKSELITDFVEDDWYYLRIDNRDPQYNPF